MTPPETPGEDTHRPRYHFLPPKNWMNDPNGLIQYKGRFHLFYQYNPFGALWGNMHWGHATSVDLVHWTHLPIALAPDETGPDADGCYSGATVVHEGVPTIVYTGVRIPDELACLATSADDDLATWTKYSGNPVIPHTPEGVATTIFRDHTLWRDGDEWLMGIGAGIEGEGGAVLLYRSPDLVEWEYLHPLVTELETLEEGERVISKGWECPDFFFLEDEPVLIACDWDVHPISVSYWTGVYEDHRFRARHHGIVDAGPTFYAPQSFHDESGRRVMIGWLRERRANEALVAAGWAGAMSLPRIVSMTDDGSLAYAPVPELEQLRGEHRRVPLQVGDVPLGPIRGDACEIRLSTESAPGESIGLDVLRSPDGEERTVIRVDPSEETVTLDTTKASTSALAFGDVARARVPGLGTAPLDLRVFVDRSIVEVFVNGRTSLSARAYPEAREAKGIAVAHTGTSAGTIDIWDLQDVMT